MIFLIFRPVLSAQSRGVLIALLQTQINAQFATRPWATTTTQPLLSAVQNVEMALLLVERRLVMTITPITMMAVRMLVWLSRVSIVQVLHLSVSSRLAPLCQSRNKKCNLKMWFVILSPFKYKLVQRPLSLISLT